MGPWYASGAWPAPVKRSLEERRLSMTPLEYIVALFAVRVWLERWEDMGMSLREDGELVVGKCNNEAACFVSRRLMAMCPSMDWCTGKQ